MDGQATTDAEGHYAITALAAGDGSGDYVLLAQAPGRVTIAYPNTPCYYLYPCPWVGFSGAVPVPNVSADFRLLHPASISGYISRTDTGRPVAGEVVYLNGGSFYPSPGAVTDATGNFQLLGLLPDRYQLEVHGGRVLLPQVYAGHDYDYFLSPYPVGDDITLSDGENLTGSDFQLHPGGIIQGTVFSGFDGDVISVGISIRRLTPFLSNGFFSAGLSTPYGFPSPGRYTIQPLLPGTFEIEFGGGQFSTEYYQHASSEAQAQVVAVATGQFVGGIDGQVAPFQTISGHITDKAAGNPVPNVIVHGGIAIFGDLSGFTDARTDNSGAYAIQGLSPGSIYVWVTRDARYIDQMYPDVLGCCLLTPGTQPVQLDANQNVTGIDMALTAGAALTGHVYDAYTGSDAVNIGVGLSDTNGHWIVSATTDSDGNFLTSAVPLGSYYVSAILQLQQDYYYYPAYLCPFFVACDLNNAQARTFSAPQVYSLDFPIPHLDLLFRDGFE